MDDWKEKIKQLGRFRIPLLALALGVALMLMPANRAAKTEDSPDALLCQALCNSEGVGRARVLISENGVVVVCSGADRAKVRLDILRAVGSYTGFGSDKITILKLEDS